jgi:hypothetical protein
MNRQSGGPLPGALLRDTPTVHAAASGRLRCWARSWRPQPSSKIEEARRNGADLHPCARRVLHQAELLPASGRIEMDRGDARVAARFAHLASEEAGKAIALCTSPLEASPGRAPRRGV